MKQRRASFAALEFGAFKTYVQRENIYLYCSNGYGNTRLSNTAIEKKLSVGVTTGNWNTVNTLLAMTR
jgi:uncharacterized protein (DUF1697 family)